MHTHTHTHTHTQDVSQGPPAAQQASIDSQTPSVAALLQGLAAGGRRGLTDASGRVLLKNLTFEELQAFCVASGRLSEQQCMG